MAAIPAWAAGYVGLPYRERGRARDGVDCWGLLRLVLADRLGAAVPAFDGLGYRDFAPDESERARAAALARYMAEHMQGWQRVPADPRDPATWPVLREGDAIHLTTLGAPIHCGVVLTPPWFLHVEEGIDSCVEQWTGFKTANRVAGFYRWIGT